MKKIYLSLIVIFFVAVFLRFYNLANIPVGFHIDEGSLGYNAYSLLVTGKDANGNYLPLYISMFGDNNPSGYYYLAIIPIKLLGLNEFATRLPAALFGSLSIFALFLLSYSIFRDKRVSLVSALLIGVAPWNVVLSRTSAEVIIAVFFVMLGFAFVILSIDKNRLSFLYGGTLLLILSFFIYPAPRIFVPLLFFSLLLLLLPRWYKQSKSKYKIAFLCSFIFLILSFFMLVFLTPGGTARFNQVSIFNSPETKLIQEEQIREDGMMDVMIPIVRLYHNKIVAYSFTFFSNYFEYFSGSFLFIKGGLPPLLSIPGMGLIYLIELPFLLLGIVALTTKRNSYYKIPLMWLLLAPVTASLTMDDIPNVRRALILFPVIELIVAYGLIVFVDTYSKRKKVLFGILICVLFLFNISYFLHQYFIHAQIHRTWYRNNGFKEMIEEVKRNQDHYDAVVLTKSVGGNGPLTLFYTQYDPQAYQAAGSQSDRDYKGFGKFIFVPQTCPSIMKDSRFPKVKKVLYVDKGDCPDSKLLLFRKYKYILKEDGTKAFRIVYD